MCRRIVIILLGALFTFLVATIAAFTYLEWWQAFLVSFATFVVVVRITKWIVTRFVVGRLTGLAKGLFDTKSRVLHNAEVDVHLVAPSSPPDDLEVYDEDEEPMKLPPNLRWFSVEVTIFPDANQVGPMSHWDVDDLVLVPFSSNVGEYGSDEDPDNDDDIRLYGVELVENGRGVELDDAKLSGPQRLKFRIAVPPMVDVLKFRYYFETFGRVELPNRAMLR